MNMLLKIAACCILLAANAFAAPAKQQLEQAVQAYDEGFAAVEREQRLRHFRRAELLFRQVAEDSTIENASLQVNLGNAALGAQRIGPAIVAFQRALAIEPGNRQARQNLEHARTLLPDWVPRPDATPAGLGSLAEIVLGLGGTSEDVVDRFLLVASLLFLCAAGTFALALRSDRKSLRNLSGLLAIAWVVAQGIAVWKTNQAAPELAVVVLPETIARAADSINSPARLPEPLPSGAEVQVMEDRSDWLRVRLFDGRDAWVPAPSLERVTR